MPNIKTFDNDVRAPTADQAGSQAFETEGRHVEASYAQAGNAIGRGIGEVGKVVEQHEEIQDTSANSVQASAAFANLSTKLSQAASDAAADPENAQKHFQDFSAAMESTIGDIGNNAVTDHGQEHAQRLQSTLREEFTRQSIGAQSIVSGQIVKNNLTTMKNNIAQAVSNNPTLLGTGIAMLQGTMEDQLKSHNLRPEEAASVRNEFTAPAVKDLSIAAFQTMAQRDPAAAREALSKGQFAGAFSGQEIGTLTSYANAQEKALAAKDKAQIELTKQANTADFKAQSSALVGSMIRPDGGLTIPPGAPQAIIKLSLHPGAEPGEIKSLAEMTQSILKDQAKGVKIVSDPQVYQSFGTKLVQGNLTEQEVYDARVQGNLSDKDTSFYLRGIHSLAQDPARKEAEKQFNAWANSQKPAFTKASGLLGLADPHGAEKFNQFSQAAHAQFEQLYNSKGDWQGALNAKNSGYLGKIAPQYMQNVKGASLPPPPRFTNDAEADKGVAALKSGQPFIGPDGQMHYKK